MTFSTGDQVYKYSLISRIGSGEFSQVWLVKDLTLNKDVALKILESGKIGVIEQLNEAQVGHRLSHPNVVRVHGADVIEYQDSEIVCIAMDYLDKGSVLGEVNSKNFVPLNMVMPYARQALRGLDYLHEVDIYHGDIKPQNIMIGESGQAMLCDYGISCDGQGGIDVYWRYAYGPHVAPESLSTDKINRKTDVYQMGLTIFRLINGIGEVRSEYEMVTPDEFNESVTSGALLSKLKFQPFVPTNLRRIILKSISTDPRARYSSALEMQRALEAINFSGSWSVDARGEWIGTDSSWVYTFDIVHRSATRSDFIAMRKNRSSGRTQSISKYTMRSLTNAQIAAQQKKFMQDVVLGKV